MYRYMLCNVLTLQEDEEDSDLDDSDMDDNDMNDGDDQDNADMQEEVYTIH
jgi:hypothetical protein